MKAENTNQSTEDHQKNVADMAHAAFGDSPLASLATDAYMGLGSDNDPMHRARSARQLNLVLQAHDQAHSGDAEAAQQKPSDEERAERFMDSTSMALEEITSGLTTMIGALPGEDARKVRGQYEISATPGDLSPKSKVEFTEDELVVATKMASLGLEYARTIDAQGIVGNHYLLAKQIWRPELLNLVVNSIAEEDSVKGGKDRVQELVQHTKTKFALRLAEAVRHNERTLHNLKADLKKPEATNPSDTSS